MDDNRRQCIRQYSLKTIAGLYPDPPAIRRYRKGKNIDSSKPINTLSCYSQQSCCQLPYTDRIKNGYIINQATSERRE